MAKSSSIPRHFIIFFMISGLVTILGKLRPRNKFLPDEILSLDLASRLHADPESIQIASSDYGNLVQGIPSAVLHPSSIDDIIELVKFSNDRSHLPFHVAARGHGHSVRGQAMARDGVVVDMTSLTKQCKNGSRIRVSWSPSLGHYADVGGEQLWIDVLHATLEHGLAPVSWTDYLYLTVGGTLSNAGISGQSFLYGPQISNVHEMDVITGKGDLISCSKHMNSELFFAVLGGLGQFGIITRARVVLDKAPKRVKWVRMLYSDFSSFTRDQEYLISTESPDYVEGSLIMDHSPPNNWRSSFFSPSHQTKIASLLKKHGIIYCLELVKYYDVETVVTIDKDVELLLLKGLNFIPGFSFKKDVSFVDFLNRVRCGEITLKSKGLWDVPHPWLNLFVPKSGIDHFNAGVFVDIVRRQNKTSGPILVYPMPRKKWDERMSAVTPDEDIFYCVGFLHSSTHNEWEVLDEQNNEILRFCDKAGIKVKQYLPHYVSKEDWMKHFGPKWNTFQQRKAQFDPKMILSPGQGIFNPVGEKYISDVVQPKSLYRKENFDVQIE